MNIGYLFFSDKVEEDVMVSNSLAPKPWMSKRNCILYHVFEIHI